MRKTTVKIPAKVNLTLDVENEKDGFHPIKSLVASVNLYDEITITARKDDKITLIETGLSSKCSVADNNAFKAAKLYSEKFGAGADIVLNKKIPVGAGLGGSSADIAGVLIAMEETFKAGADVVSLANTLGSDSGYMVGGGTAVISGRGEIVDKIDADLKLYILIINEEEGVSTRECYRLSDEYKKLPPVTDEAVEYLLKGNCGKFLSLLKNDLYEAAVSIQPKIAENISALLSVGAFPALMTGSGSAVYGVYSDKKSLEDGYKKLLPTYQNRLIKAETVNN